MSSNSFTMPDCMTDDTVQLFIKKSGSLFSENPSATNALAL